jgi:hypothetical protein
MTQKLIKSSLLVMLITFLIGAITMSMINIKTTDDDYQKAISIAEKSFSTFQVNREKYKLIKIENEIFKNIDSWKLTYLSKELISKDGRREGKGGETFISVNIKTENATIGWGE